MKSFFSLWFVLVFKFAPLSFASFVDDIRVPVKIAVKCTGLDLMNLDAVSSFVIGQIVEKSYMNIHNSNDNGSTLKIQSHANWKCGRLCDDDAVLMKESTESTNDGTLYLNGEIDCGKFCPDDENVVMGNGIRGNDFVLKRKWEKELTNGLVDSGRSNFRMISSFAIKKTLSTKTTVA